MRRFLLLSAAVLLPLSACGKDGTGSQGQRAASLRLSVATVDMADGDTARLSASVFDDRGQAIPGHPLASSLEWSTSSAAVAGLEPDAAGRTARVRAAGPGVAWVRVRAGGFADSARVSVASPATAVERVSAEDLSGSAGLPLADSLAVRVTDRRGDGKPGVPVVFAVRSGGGSVSAASVPTGADGVAKVAWTLGSTPGPNEASATVQLASGSQTLAFRATGAVGPAMEITAISPAVLVPGTSATLQGTGFGTDPAALAVRVGGVDATVTALTPTQLTITLAPVTAYPCQSTRPVAVTVGATSRSHPLRVATPRELATGQAATLYTAGEAHCTELSAGRYLLTAFNSGTATDAMTTFRLEGGGAAASPALARAPAAPARGLAPAARGPEARAETAHLRLLEENRQTVRQLGAPRWPSRAARRSLSTAPAEVGEEMSLRVPGTGSNGCTRFTEVTARVVYAGTRTVILEDRAAPLAGTMDEHFRRAGEEMDGRMTQILLENFGNPVAVHAPQGAGRVLVLATPQVNAMDGPLGFVTAKDFYPRAQCPASNEAAILYALVPTGVVPGNAFTGSGAAWYRTMRSTLIHETKHLASLAERLARRGELEVSWLEESTARIAEEIWARDYFGGAPGSDAGYDPAVRCSVAECAGKPYVMSKHFGALYLYLRQPDVQTPLGPGSLGNSSFYGSGWSLVRWAADHSGVPEAEFFRALTQETELQGTANLEARAGHPWQEMVGEWSVALATDGRPGWVPANPRHRFPSWNLHQVFTGMNGDAPGIYGMPHPLTPRTLSAALIAEDSPGVRTGSATTFVLVVPPTRTAVGLRGTGGAPLASTMHLAIVRIE